MILPQESYLQFTPDLKICRLLNGMWQVSGGHGRINPKTAIESMFQYVDSGFTTWDLADHYGPAEDFIGEFRRQLIANRGEEAVNHIQAFTKWVPRPGKMTRKLVEENIDISLKRMNVKSLDLMQFHWWEYRDNNYLDALQYMVELQNEGKIKHLALTNFDTEHLQIITAAGIKIVSNQVQFSLVDRRPQVNMVNFCQEHDIKLFTYGTICGGLLSEKYLQKPEPKGLEINTTSLRKYKQMIDNWGGWGLFQELLNTLKTIADKYQVSITNVAVNYILNQPAVGGVIVGARLGIAEHLSDNARVFTFNLDAEDMGKIDAVSQHSRDLYQLIGDCGDEYRR
ncbi:MAG: aldo/keto reductase [Anabaena sp. CoA2_C59]|jgi:aryl-alcohol dehydrogenase-like predicted oxidoreductase|uniref:Aldo/keto reductase n=3 Tax=Aphanizomenon flos-aquae TaxID=1176 RepID=A0A1B7X1F5_APHFL|nr:MULTISPECIES: aldo/keto reductase [Aphanizomenon]MBD1219553.1 aldo/keto reductase [Aphanizomenon flos-aquae Clear-A1]MCE2907150.1 aldo/keto reductase [Anabaena sp. CoA2_C59]MDJ0506963.1 aldo/keto reductase [Nostocales cyanobacterium LE14-WE12]NTW19785.1 aldo/keto reductase [Nostocales cyanobacterium W4_Combined_metabat2_030]OBQ43214.1 MAG: aldo/keto reductase [Aphanizomenon flos-aquae WA102]